MLRVRISSSKKWLRVAMLGIGSMLAVIVVAQEVQGRLGRSTSGTLGLALRKDKGQGGVGVSVPGRGNLPVLLPDAVADALVTKRNASFPLCITGTDAASTVSIVKLPAANGSQSLITSAGSRVAYSVGLLANKTDLQAGTQCKSGSMVEVGVSIGGNNTGTWSALYGAIPLLILVE